MNEIELYHVSINKYDSGTILEMSNNDETHYYRKKRLYGDNWVDDFLNNYKPSEAPKRQQTFYAFDSAENCIAFAKTNNLSNPYYYKVNMLKPFKAPMCLTDLILKSQGDKIKQERIAKDYWNTGSIWKFNEYLSNRMEIIEIIMEPHFLAIVKGKENYQHDIDLIKKLF